MRVAPRPSSLAVAIPLPTMTDTSVMKSAKLALQDGSVFTGWSFGADGETTGEVCFNTSLTGYQEILTDPSYRGQIIVMTYPLIGNTGVNREDVESRRPFAAGFVVKEPARLVSNHRAAQSLDAYLREHGILGLAGIDTRALTRKLRTQGALNGVLTTHQLDDAALAARAARVPGLVGRDLVAEVAPDGPCDWREGYTSAFAPTHTAIGGERLARAPRCPDRRPWRVVAIDCGAKYNILRSLAQAGCDVTVLPAGASADAVRERKPDGLFLSNGPGDPEAVTTVIDTVRALLGKLPIFGICLGHQMLSLAMGASTFKLKFGHRGGNQPVLNLDNGRTEITSQNHGFAVEPESLKRVGGEPTHISLNDGTLEGFRHRDLPVFAVQYHPEASPGPHDATYLFAAFAEMMASGRPPKYA